MGHGLSLSAPEGERGEAGGASRRLVLAGLAGIVAGFTAHNAEAQMSPTDTSVRKPAARAVGENDSAYESPYSLAFSSNWDLLDAGFDQTPWDDPEAESAQPFSAWQAANAGHRRAAWGPPARQYPAPVLPRPDATYLQERVIAIAARHIGLAYQHHHVPSWVPPANWPWLRVYAGQNGPGLDCSNFTSFVFNYALGIKLPTAVGLQARSRVLRGPGGVGCQRAQRIAVAHFAALRTSLAPADLLYIRNLKGQIRHVVMWLGAIGQDPKDDALVIDCSQTVHQDFNGVTIPPGVRLRPFREEGCYWRNFSHAHRIIGVAAPRCGHAPPGFMEGGDLT